MTLLEVKSSSQDLDIFPVVKSRQIRRLFAARMYLQEKHETEVELLLAVVSHRGGSSLNPRIRYFAGECLLT